MLTWRFSTLLIWLPAPWHHICAGAFSHPWSPVPRTTQLTGCGKCSGPRAPFCKLFLLATLGKAKWHCVDGPDLTWWFGKVRTRAHGWLLYLLYTNVAAAWWFWPQSYQILSSEPKNVANLASVERQGRGGTCTIRRIKVLSIICIISNYQHLDALHCCI